MDLNNTSSMGGRLRSASLDLLRSASLDLLKSSSISLLKCVANSSNSASDSVAQHLKVGGGMTSNNLLMQFQADLLGLSLYRPYVRTATPHRHISLLFFVSCACDSIWARRWSPFLLRQICYCLQLFVCLFDRLSSVLSQLAVCCDITLPDTHLIWYAQMFYSSS